MGRVYLLLILQHGLHILQFFFKRVIPETHIFLLSSICLYLSFLIINNLNGFPVILLQNLEVLLGLIKHDQLLADLIIDSFE